jgi:hypothetical protein
MALLLLTLSIETTVFLTRGFFFALSWLDALFDI